MIPRWGRWGEYRSCAFRQRHALTLKVVFYPRKGNCSASPNAVGASKQVLVGAPLLPCLKAVLKRNRVLRPRKLASKV